MYHIFTFSIISYFFFLKTPKVRVLSWTKSVQQFERVAAVYSISLLLLLLLLLLQFKPKYLFGYICKVISLSSCKMKMVVQQIPGVAT